MSNNQKPNQASQPAEPKFDERHTWSQNPYHTQDHRHIAFKNGAKMQFQHDRSAYQALQEKLRVANAEARVHLMSCIFKNIEEIGAEDTLDWLKSRYHFEKNKIEGHE